jgi:hypothetical protein
MDRETGDKEMIKAAAGQLVTAMADLQDSLCFMVESKGSAEGAELNAFQYSSDALSSFADSSPQLRAAKPRSVRDADRARLLPGQHSGVYLQFSAPDGTILFLNFKGGLRILSSGDLRDTDVFMKQTHTKTTDKVLEQPVELNWQLLLPGGPKIDSWIVLNQSTNTYRLSSLEIDGDKFDIHPSLQKGDAHFDDIKGRISSATRDLTGLIPSSS